MTSQDINNTAFPMMMRDAWIQVLNPFIDDLLKLLKELSENWWQILMPAHTRTISISLLD